MIGLFFEVEPLPGHSGRYFEHANRLKPELNANPGLLFIDRWTSIDRPDVILSHSWWSTEDALITWRRHAGHCAVQRAGRELHFKDYRIRIGRLCPAGESLAGAREIHAAYHDAEPARRAGSEVYKSVYRENKWLVVGDEPIEQTGVDAKCFAVLRNYTMYDRSEAPQYYPPVARR